MADTVTRIRWDPASIRELKFNPDVARVVHEVARGLAEDMRSRAPYDTGAGRASIYTHDDRRSKGSVDAGWDAEHFYMLFPEYGTKYQRAQRFARDALDRYNYA